MTKAELSKEMESNGFQIVKKIHLILVVVFMFVGVGINIGISQTQLANKVDPEDARKIAKEEVQIELKHFFTDSDGKVLQSQMQDLKEHLKTINYKLDRLLNKR